ncbi:hypothetical protein ACX27_17945 [Nostoc piscinale CENA21]|uniref:Uncharacterized protein n=1 Tax=Nostoc piscinale CENA21 TaxID=224013 RepID=A0A0M4SSW8_9NOSO|nr:hypothetical protein [Nostoc piscinale]ALF54302.1 hypothetical protein ACX27_17945 [Nostoc piscinale CENA21]
MAKIVIDNLVTRKFNSFLDHLKSIQAKTIQGGGYPYSFYINNFTDSASINSTGGDITYEAVNHSFSYHDNNIHGIDYSSSIYNIFFH